MIRSPERRTGWVLLLATLIGCAEMGDADLTSEELRPDHSPPAVSITSPADGAAVAGTITIAGTASDNRQVTLVEVRIDNGAYTAASGTTSWSWSWDTASVAAGSHTIQARAHDQAGLTATASVVVTVSSGAGSTNLAAGKLPTSNDPNATGLSYATDGSLASGSYANLASGARWIQIDLGQGYPIDKVTWWHYYADGRTYHDVIVQLSSSATFSSGVTTIFNDDRDGSTGQGAGADVEYAETSGGAVRTLSTAVSARYVRLWSNGSTANAWNHHVEVQVFASGSSGGVAVAVSPSSASLTVGQSASFTATVTGATDTRVTWSVQEGGAGGTISASGVYTAPATAGTYHVVATSVADPSRSAVATVAVAVASGRARFDITAPAGTAGFPRNLTYCADHIVLDAREIRADNVDNNVPRDEVATNWDDPRFSWWSSFPGWLARRAQIDGHYLLPDRVPTTTEIFSFAACRWGVREDLLRAVAVQESDWHESGWGDRCSQTNPDLGIGSYGIMQVKNFNCSSEGDWGGFRRTFESTPFNVDFYGAAFRACLEGALWYAIPAGDDLARRERGCVGAWFSGSYAPDSAYTVSVYQHLVDRIWEQPGF